MARSNKNSKNIESVISMRKRLRKNARRRSAANKSTARSNKDYSTTRSTTTNNDCSRSGKRLKYKSRRRSSSSSSSRTDSSSSSSSSSRGSRYSRSEKKMKKRVTKKEKVSVPTKNKRRASTKKPEKSSRSIYKTSSQTSNGRRSVPPVSTSSESRNSPATNSNASSFDNSKTRRSSNDRSNSSDVSLPDRSKVSIPPHSLKNCSSAVFRPSRCRLGGPVLEDVCCNLQLPLFIESVQKVRITPKDEQITIVSTTIIKSSDMPLSLEEQASVKLYPAIDHHSAEREKGRNEEISKNRVLIGKNTMHFERTTVIKRSELQENLAKQSNKEHNHLARCIVNGISGPLSIHCAQNALVSGDIYQKKEFISMFLVAEPQMLKREQLDGILSTRLIQDQLPEVSGEKIRTSEKMTSSGNYILMLERDTRIVCNKEMWTNENEYVISEKRTFEFGKNTAGEMSIIETKHDKSKQLLELAPTFLNRISANNTSTPNVSGSSIPRVVRTSLDLNNMPQSSQSKRAPANQPQPSSKSVERNSSSRSASSDKHSDVENQKPKPILKTPEKPVNLSEPKSQLSASKGNNTSSIDPAPTNDVSIRNDNVTPNKSPTSISFSGNSNSKKEDVKNALIGSKIIQERTKTPKKTDSSVGDVVSDDTTSFVPAWNRTPRSKSLLSVCSAASPVAAPARTPVNLNTTVPATISAAKDGTLTANQQKKATSQPPVRYVSTVTEKIDLRKKDSSKTKRCVVIKVECEINEVPCWLFTNLEIKSDTKKIDFAAKKVVCEGNTMWQAGPEPAKSKTSPEPAPKSSKSEQPAPKSPMSEQPVPKSPKSEQLAAKSPMSEQPAPKSPKSEQPVPKLPLSEQQAPKSPMSEQPAPKSPKSEQPVPKSPKSEQPVPKLPLSEQQAPKSPMSEQPAPKSPMSEQPAPKSPKSGQILAPNTPKSKCRITRYANVSGAKKREFY